MSENPPIFSKMIIVLNFDFVSIFTGEYEFGDIPLKSWHHKIYLLIFAFLCVVVILNVLTGVAIIEVDLIKKQAQILAIKTQLNIIYHTETFLLKVCPFLYNGFYEKIIPREEEENNKKLQQWTEIELHITPNNYKTCCTNIWNSDSDVCCNYYYHFYCRFLTMACLSPFAPCLQNLEKTGNRQNNLVYDKVKQSIQECIEDLNAKEMLENIAIQEKYGFLKGKSCNIGNNDTKVLNNDLQKDFHKEVKNIHNNIFVNEKARKNFSALSAIFNDLKEDSNADENQHENLPEIEQDAKKSGDKALPKQMVAGIQTKYMSIVPKWILKSLKLKTKDILISRITKKSSSMIVQEIMELLKDIENEET